MVRSVESERKQLLTRYGYALLGQHLVRQHRQWLPFFPRLSKLFKRNSNVYNNRKRNWRYKPNESVSVWSRKNCVGYNNNKSLVIRWIQLLEYTNEQYIWNPSIGFDQLSVINNTRQQSSVGPEVSMDSITEYLS